MAKKIWKNAEVVWDENSDPSNPGWVIKADEVEGDGETTPMTWSPHPDYYHADADADKAEILAATAYWESATIR